MKNKRIILTLRVLDANFVNILSKKDGDIVDFKTLRWEPTLFFRIRAYPVTATRKKLLKEIGIGVNNIHEDRFLILQQIINMKSVEHNVYEIHAIVKSNVHLVNTSNPLWATIISVEGKELEVIITMNRDKDPSYTQIDVVKINS